jgi:hypothetical protein
MVEKSDRKVLSLSQEPDGNMRWREVIMAHGCGDTPRHRQGDTRMC